MLDMDTRRPNSARRERHTGRLRGQRGLEELGITPVAQRRSREVAPPVAAPRSQNRDARAPRQLRPQNYYQEPDEQEYTTDEDEALQVQPGHYRKRAEPESRPEPESRRAGNGGGGRDQCPAKTATQPRNRRRVHPLLLVGVGLLLALLLWTGITHLIAWGQSSYNTAVYGYPRTFQIDFVVGHGDSPEHPSHFIALNLHGTVIIEEFPGSDPSKGRVLSWSNLIGQDADQAVVTLRFIDFSHNGKPDLIITVNGIQSVLVNDGKTFRTPTPAEKQQIMQELQ